MPGVATSSAANMAHGRGIAPHKMWATKFVKFVWRRKRHGVSRSQEAAWREARLTKVVNPREPSLRSSIGTTAAPEAMIATPYDMTYVVVAAMGIFTASTNQSCSRSFTFFPSVKVCSPATTDSFRSAAPLEKSSVKEKGLLKPDDGRRWAGGRVSDTQSETKQKCNAETNALEA